MKICSMCHKEIPKKRLKAMPNATMCAPCLTALGDVTLMLRFDETAGEGIVETFTKGCPGIIQQIKRERTHIPSSKMLAEATESEIIEPMAAEINADARSNDTAFQILSEQETLDAEEI